MAASLPDVTPAVCALVLTLTVALVAGKQSVAIVLHGTVTDSVVWVAATTMGPLIVGTVTLAKSKSANRGVTVKLAQAGAVCLTPIMPFTTPTMGATPAIVLV